MKFEFLQIWPIQKIPSCAPKILNKIWLEGI
jgi:hypothetical protein